MATMWRRAINFLGLDPESDYDEELPRHGPDPSFGAPSSDSAPPEPPEPYVGAVRPLPRQHEGDPAAMSPGPARPRGAVVRPITPAAVTSKPFTVSPSAFNQAQEVADRFMAGTPVILNLQGTDRELSRRLVDFASGLCYGMRGQMEKVTNQVYLLTPSNTKVSAEDRSRLQERRS